MTKESDIMYETATHWVCKAKHGFEVYKIGVTHSTRCAIIGWHGEKGLGRAITECDKRSAL